MCRTALDCRDGSFFVKDSRWQSVVVIPDRSRSGTICWEQCVALVRVFDGVGLAMGLAMGLHNMLAMTDGQIWST